MAPTSPCPDETALRRLALGQLADEEAAPLEEHLAGCDRCVAALQALPAGDSLVRGLQEARDAAPLPEEERIERLARRLQGMRPDAGPGPEGPPDRLGEYRIVREVGRGGMGVVYEAVQESLGRRVALKVLPTHALLAAEHRERFQREAKAAAQLHHTNIVPVFGVGQDRGVHFYAMQFIHGQSLDRVLGELRRARGKPAGGPDLSASLAAGLQTGRFPGTAGPASPSPAQPTGRAAAGGDTPRSGLAGSPEGVYFRGVARVGVQVAEALAYAHQQGILHRDVKPSNLLLDAQGTVWVTDFGLAWVEGSDQLTGVGDVVGTLRYLAPERFAGRSDPRSDVYSLGATLYELLTLRPAFDEPDRARLIERVTHGAPPSPRQLDGRIPRDLETIVLKALSWEPAERYPTAEALADDLRRFLLDRPIRARRSGAAERAWRWCRRNPVVAGLLAASVVLAAGLAVLAVLLANNVLRLQAEQQRVVAEEARKEAALEAEAEQRGRAEANLKLALRALDEIVLRPAEPFAGRPEEGHLPLPPEQLEQVERGLLQKGLAFYDEFARANQANAPLRGEVAKAYQRVGLICVALRVHDKAELAFRRALPLLENLVEECPEALEYRQTLLSTYHGLGHVLKAIGRHAEAEDLLRRDVALARKLVAEFPAVVDYRGDLCTAYSELGGLYRESGRPAEAERVYRQALDLGRQLVAEASTPAGTRGQLYLSCRLLGNLLSDAGRHREAEQPYGQALDLARQLLAAEPAVADYRHNLATSQTNLARVLVHNDRLAEAEQSYRRTLALEEKLAARFPQVVAHRYAPARSHVGLGDVLWVAGRYPEAADEYRRALGVKPDDADAHWKLAWFLANCPETRYRDPTRAVEQAKKALERTGLNGHYWKALGLASYRAGDWDGAIGALVRANFFSGGGGSYEWFPLAMAHGRRGDPEQARQWYARACGWMEEHKGGFSKEPGFYWEEEFRRLRAEAAGVLGLPEPPSPAGEKAPRKD
jgi:serine/threonine protein kinase